MSVIEAVLEIDGNSANPGDLLDACELVLAILESALGNHALGGFNHDCDHAGRLACFVQDGRIVQVHPDLLWTAVSTKREFLISIGQGAAAQAHLHDMVVEVGDLGPTVAHFRAKQLGMSAARKA